MPREYRSLTFTNTELRDLLLEYADETNQQLHLPEIRAILIDPDKQEQLICFCSSVDHQSNEAINLVPDFVKSAIINFCADNKIPLPASASKTLLAEGNSLSLICRTHIEYVLSQNEVAV